MVHGVKWNDGNRYENFFNCNVSTADKDERII